MLGTELIPTDWIQKWNHNGRFELQSSGSTGDPKTYYFETHLMRWSAEQTRKHFIKGTKLKQLIALPLDKTGGFMQWARAQTWGTAFDAIEPCSNPLLEYSGNAKLSSFTPMQIEHILNHDVSREKLHQFQNILIGGGPISQELEDRLLQDFPHTNWVHTFGMTETYSHFAGRTLGEPLYRLIDETEIEANDTGLRLRNPCTKNQWMQTHDIIELFPKNTFKWIGRSDFTINSGGIKIQLERVEAELQGLTGWQAEDFFCWYEEDPILGQKLVLYTKNGLQLPLNLQFSSRFYNPKAVYQRSNFAYSSTGKILREKTVTGLI